MKEDIKLDSIKEAIAAIKNGEVIVVVDDEDRENEGDFICAAEKITPEIVNFMAREGRGLLCVPLVEARCDELQLDLLVHGMDHSRTGTFHSYPLLLPCPLCVVMLTRTL